MVWGMESSGARHFWPRVLPPPPGGVCLECPSRHLRPRVVSIKYSLTPRTSQQRPGQLLLPRGSDHLAWDDLRGAPLPYRWYIRQTLVHKDVGTGCFLAYDLAANPNPMTYLALPLGAIPKGQGGGRKSGCSSGWWPPRGW